MPSIYGVYVVRDNAAWGGYRVNAWRRTEYYKTKFFADLKNDGKRNAKKLAKAYQDKLKKAVPAKLAKQMLKKKVHGKTWGKGVYLCESPAPDGGVYKSWRGTWQDHETGCKVSKSYSVRKWGFNEARRRATLARKRGVAKKLVMR